MKDHIVKAFDEELRDLNRNITEMADLCLEQLSRAGETFKTMDRDLASELIRDDEAINRCQQDIQDESVRIIARRAPVAVDLRHILSAMRIASKIERIADYAANIARQVRELSQTPSEDISGLIVEMDNLCRTMLADAVAAFTDLDEEKARQVWHKDDEVDRKFARMMRLVRRQMQDESNLIPDGTQLIFIGRFFERIGDHITNIAEDIYYTKTGLSFIGSFDGDNT